MKTLCIFFIKHSFSLVGAQLLLTPPPQTTPVNEPLSALAIVGYPNANRRVETAMRHKTVLTIDET